MLPTRLRDTTLGDLLAALYREHASGALEIIEPARRHEVHLRSGLVQGVTSEGDGLRFGELVVTAGFVDPQEARDAVNAARDRGVRVGQQLVVMGALSVPARDRVLEWQRQVRLDALDALADAEVRFHVMRPLPPGVVEQRPMEPREVLHGRRRRREVVMPVARTSSPRVTALKTLGLDERATRDTVRERYRSLVSVLHPDHAHHVDADERARRVERLRAVIDAYQQLAG
jgi:hypothetical protein